MDYNLFLKSAFAYIENRVNSEISMDEVARVAGFSTAHFRDVFRGATADEQEFPAEAPLPMLMERLMCQIDAQTVVGEGRWNAGLFLKREAERFPEVGSSLRAGADYLKKDG
ncbi:MAG: hypothetical protein M1379_16770 [Firmicutes bacterium]|nr:hypothetical protein [Bacillota bacterium]